ncbi:hypothetical protein KC902_04050 [Candidatus Kaiserbacteria bacterium]|nr:hypothetical protein [Candidatus Kaiserbacteria bacterium]
MSEQKKLKKGYVDNFCIYYSKLGSKAVADHFKIKVADLKELLGKEKFDYYFKKVDESLAKANKSTPTPEATEAKKETDAEVKETASDAQPDKSSKTKKQ